METKSEFHILPRSGPLKRLLRLAITLSVIAVVAMLAYGWGADSAPRNAALDAAEVRGLRDQVSLLGANVRTSAADRSHWQRRHKIDQLVREEIRDELARLDNQNSLLLKELDFYHNLIAQEPGAGIRVHEFEVEPVSLDSDTYRYRLVLTQGPAQKAMAKGLAKVRVFMGNVEQQPLAAVEDAYGFRHFQLLEGSLELPQAARPVQVVVELVPQEQAEPEVRFTFPWNHPRIEGESDVG